jgi:AraC family transcriptional regulator of adaptative response / DNA-3-methyladenine glycosylase II
MLPEQHICERARLSRDPRFDGAFFVGVVTTGVYCRPVCPVRPPAAQNVRFYPSAAAAEEAGFRPCRRCLPETAARIPEWAIASRTVLRGLRLIDAGALEQADSAALAAALGVTPRHLSRLFRQELGATPRGLASSRRRALAKRLIDDTDLPLGRIAMEAGYGSLRRFNDDLRRVFRRSPRELRAARRQHTPGQASGVTLRLPVRAPYDADWVFDFLARRALAGVEEVDGHRYRRWLPGSARREGGAWIEVRWDGDALVLALPANCPVPVSEVLPRVRRVFDLDAEPLTIGADLARDSLLASAVAAAPGLRVPGAWDGFEIAVRAILGQQVSVDRATVLAHGLMARFGADCLTEPARLARADVAAVGMPGRRGEAIRRLAAAVADGGLDLHEGADSEALGRALCALPGIGPWTAGYVTMRVAKDPDAFPANDWVVLKMLEQHVPDEARAAAAGRAGSRADGWRPWRAYAVMYLWHWSARLRAARARAGAREA